MNVTALQTTNLTQLESVVLVCMSIAVLSLLKVDLTRSSCVLALILVLIFFSVVRSTCRDLFSGSVEAWACWPGL